MQGAGHIVAASRTACLVKSTGLKANRSQKERQKISQSHSNVEFIFFNTNFPVSLVTCTGNMVIKLAAENISQHWRCHLVCRMLPEQALPTDDKHA